MSLDERRRWEEMTFESWISEPINWAFLAIGLAVLFAGSVSSPPKTWSMPPSSWSGPLAAAPVCSFFSPPSSWPGSWSSSTSGRSWSCFSSES
jgi:hypothetical protein